MTTEEIIKSLEACAVHRNCDAGCVFANANDHDCLTNIMAFAATRLKELTTKEEKKL